MGMGIGASAPSQTETSKWMLFFVMMVFLIIVLPRSAFAEGPADYCEAFFTDLKVKEARLESIKQQPLRMVRLGNSLDVELYDRLALVRRRRIAAATTEMRSASSALTSCMARAVAAMKAQPSQPISEEAIAQAYANSQVKTAPIAPVQNVAPPVMQIRRTVQPNAVPVYPGVYPGVDRKPAASGGVAR